MMHGYPKRLASSMASSALLIEPAEPGISGSPAFFMVFRATVLSPNFLITDGEGPMKDMPDLRTSSAKGAFSDKKP
jgi:hypothetical protein